MTFEPPPPVGELSGGKKQEVVKVTPVTSSLQAKNESGGTVVRTRVIVHKNCTRTLFRSGRHRCGVCVCVRARKCVPTRLCVHVCVMEEARE